MDMGALKTDVKTALRSLPKELVDVLMYVAESVLAKHRKELEDKFPLIVEYLKPHAMAVMMEVSCGIVDKAELERTLTEALAEVVAERQVTSGAHAG